MKSTMIEQLRNVESAINSMYSVEAYVTSTVDRAGFATAMTGQIVHILTAPFFQEFVDAQLRDELRGVAATLVSFADGKHLSYCYITVVHKTK